MLGNKDPKDSSCPISPLLLEHFFGTFWRYFPCLYKYYILIFWHSGPVWTLLTCSPCIIFIIFEDICWFRPCCSRESMSFSLSLRMSLLLFTHPEGVAEWHYNHLLWLLVHAIYRLVNDRFNVSCALHIVRHIYCSQRHFTFSSTVIQMLHKKRMWFQTFMH